MVEEETQIGDIDDSDKAVSDVIADLTSEETELITTMMELGVFYGSSKSRTNPKMRDAILINRSGFSIIDLRKTVAALKKIKEILMEIVGSGGVVLLVGTSPSVKSHVEEMAKVLDLPFVSSRWLGGTLTNFETINKRVKHFKKLKETKQTGGWEKYTKKEKLNLERELKKLETLFSGIENMVKLPEAIFIVDAAHNEIAAREAKIMGIKILGILNTDAEPDLVDYGIPANERSQKSIEFLMQQIKEAILEAKNQLLKANTETKPTLES